MSITKLLFGCCERLRASKSISTLRHCHLIFQTCSECIGGVLRMDDLWRQILFSFEITLSTENPNTIFISARRPMQHEQKFYIFSFATFLSDCSLSVSRPRPYRDE